MKKKEMCMRRKKVHCVCVGIHMNAHIPLLIIDWKEFQVMSAYY
jgi:hypothetical protein